MPPTPITANAKLSFVFLNGRFKPSDQQSWTIPPDLVFILTDLVAQNKGGATGDAPVNPTDFTRLAITAPLSIDTFFHVVGNETLNLHFHSGLPISDSFRFLNMANSTPGTFVEFQITGKLRSAY